MHRYKEKVDTVEVFESTVAYLNNHIQQMQKDQKQIQDKFRHEDVSKRDLKQHKSIKWWLLITKFFSNTRTVKTKGYTFVSSQLKQERNEINQSK